MTFDQLFRGRLALMRAQKHLNQRAVVFHPLTRRWRRSSSPDYKAYFILERLLVDLENEFEAKKKRQRRAA